MKFAHSLSAVTLGLSLAVCGTNALAQTARPAAPAASAPVELTAEQVEAYEKAGHAAALVWLNQLDAGMWGETWDQGSRLFKSNVTLATWMDNIPKERGSLGRATARELKDSVVNTTMQGQPSGVYVSLLFGTKFANAEMEEIVSTMREPDGRFRVTGYSKR